MIALLSAVLLLAAETPTDLERAAWRYKRTVTTTGPGSMATLTLPPELSANAGPGGRDLRLVDEDGRETPYLLDWTSEREGFATWRAEIRDVRREKEAASIESPVRSQWTIDLGTARTFTEIHVDVRDTAFAWHVRVETSVDGSAYGVVRADASVFDQTWNGERVRRTDIQFDDPLTARYLRLTARSASGLPMLELTGASVTLRRRMKGDAWSMGVPAVVVDEPVAARPGTIRYRLSGSSLLPFDEVEISSDEPAFSRRARLVEVFDDGSRKPRLVLGEGTVFRLRSNDAFVAGESVRFAARNGSGGTLHLEIDNASSPPLSTLRVRLHGARVRLVFPATTKTLTLYYGNETTRAPSYDIEALRPRLLQALALKPASLGAELTNEAFRREPPLRFGATLGAALDPRSWRHERLLAPILEEDVYALTLRASDLGTLRPDLADLRVVNEANFQVPFLIDNDFATDRIPMMVRREAPSTPKRSLFSMAPESRGAEDAPRIYLLELDVKEAFFERPARLLHSHNRSAREIPFSITLARRPPSSDGITVGASAPLEALTLEVDDGDNAPLEIKAAAALVRVPRVVFKAAPGKLRLLLGNRSAESPRYDITGLRLELLAYSAIAASPGSLSLNEHATTSLWSGVFGMPRSALVWGAILLALVVLVGLTLRTIRNA